MKIPEQFHYVQVRRIEFSDTDMAGIVHFSNLFRFVETAEHEMMRELEIPVFARTTGMISGWPRIEVSCTFLKPARFGEAIETCLRLDEIEKSTFSYRFLIRRSETEGRTISIATGAMVVARAEVDQATGRMRSALISEELRTKLSKLPLIP